MICSCSWNIFFTGAITFASSSVPGITVVALTSVDFLIRGVGAWSFLLCSLVEVFLICILKPGKAPRVSSESAVSVFISAFASLLLLYVAACLVVSVLGGILDFVVCDVLPENKSFFSPEDAFKTGFLRDASPALLANILARIPINIVDRFVVIFGGFLLSLFLRKILK